jgi:malonyl-CoA O-methyltransferase
MSREPEQRRHQVDKRGAGASFGAAAANYEQSAVLQAKVRSRLLERLDLVKLTPTRILDLGAGTGAAARLLSRRYRRARILSLDISEQMLMQARSNAPRFARKREYVCADAECLPLAEASTEFVFSNMALQWCNNLDSVFSELSRVLTPGGLLLFASLGPDTLQELRETWAAVDQHTHVNAFIDMHDLGDALIRAGFTGPVLDVEHFTLTYENLAELMRDLKAIGAHNVTEGRSRGLLGRQRWSALNGGYEKFRRDGRLPSTYEVVYGHAWAPEAGARAQDGSTVASFPFESLRKTLPGRST